MALYQELYDLCNDSSLKNRTAIACVIAANAIRTEAGATANHANRLLWAKAALANPVGEAARMLPAVLAQNVASTVAQIQAATDATLQTAVNNAVDLFATGS